MRFNRRTIDGLFSVYLIVSAVLIALHGQISVALMAAATLPSFGAGFLPANPSARRYGIRAALLLSSTLGTVLVAWTSANTLPGWILAGGLTFGVLQIPLAIHNLRLMKDPDARQYLYERRVAADRDPP